MKTSSTNQFHKSEEKQGMSRRNFIATTSLGLLASLQSARGAEAGLGRLALENFKKRLPDAYNCLATLAKRDIALHETLDNASGIASRKEVIGQIVRLRSETARELAVMAYDVGQFVDTGLRSRKESSKKPLTLEAETLGNLTSEQSKLLFSQLRSWIDCIGTTSPQERLSTKNVLTEAAIAARFDTLPERFEEFKRSHSMSIAASPSDRPLINLKCEGSTVFSSDEPGIHIVAFSPTGELTLSYHVSLEKGDGAVLDRNGDLEMIRILSFFGRPNGTVCILACVGIGEDKPNLTSDNCFWNLAGNPNNYSNLGSYCLVGAGFPLGLLEAHQRKIHLTSKGKEFHVPNLFEKKEEGLYVMNP